MITTGVPFVSLDEALQALTAGMDRGRWRVSFSRGDDEIGWVIVLNPIDDDSTGLGFLARNDSLGFHLYSLDRLTRVESGRYRPATEMSDLSFRKVLLRLLELASPADGPTGLEAHTGRAQVAC